jgi:hypothetical protein
VTSDDLGGRGDPDWIAYGDPLNEAQSEAFAPPSALPGIFIFPLWQASLPRSKIKMPLQLR